MKEKVLAYIPVDLPKPQYSAAQLLEFFNKNCETHRDHSSQEKSRLDQVLELWDIVTVRRSREADAHGEPSSWYKYQPDDSSWYWALDFETKFPGIVENLASLPFERLTYVALFRNKRAIPLHQDRLHIKDMSGKMVGHLSLDQKSTYVKKMKAFYEQNVENQDPASYRYILYGQGDKNFVVSPTLKTEDSLTCHLPQETSCFLFNTHEVYHGATENPSGKILMYVSGLLKPDQHQALLEKSLKKYADEAIFFESAAIQKEFGRVPLQK